MLLRPPPLREVLRWLAFGLAALLFSRLLLSADSANAFSLVRERGPALLAGLAPFLIFELADTAAWRRLIRGLGHFPDYAALLRARISAEAVNLTLPGGGPISEAMTPSLLHRVCGIPIPDGVVAMGARRWTVLRAHSVYLILAGILATVGRTSKGGFLPWLLFGSAVVALGVASGLRALFEQKGGSTRIESLLERFPGSLRRYFAQRRASFAAVDRSFARFAAAERKDWPATTAMYFGCWMIESFETYLLLRLLGAEVGFAGVVAVEAAASFVRSAAFVAPAGLGFQDLGYLTLFDRVPRHLVLAFVALKRGKELLWAGVGYLVMFASGRPKAAALAQPSP